MRSQELCCWSGATTVPQSIYRNDFVIFHFLPSSFNSSAQDEAMRPEQQTRIAQTSMMPSLIPGIS